MEKKKYTLVVASWKVVAVQAVQAAGLDPVQVRQLLAHYVHKPYPPEVDTYQKNDDLHCAQLVPEEQLIQLCMHGEH